MDSLFLNAAKLIWTKQIDLSADDIRALLVMTNTTAFADIASAQFLSGANGVATLDEMDGSGYSRQALAGKVVDTDVVTKVVRWKFSAITFGATVANGTRQVKALLIYKHVGADSANIPIMWRDSVNSGLVFPFSPGGGPVTASYQNNIALTQAIASS